MPRNACTHYVKTHRNKKNTTLNYDEKNGYIHENKSVWLFDPIKSIVSTQQDTWHFLLTSNEKSSQHDAKFQWKNKKRQHLLRKITLKQRISRKKNREYENRWYQRLRRHIATVRQVSYNYAAFSFFPSLMGKKREKLLNYLYNYIRTLLINNNKKLFPNINTLFWQHHSNVANAGSRLK